MAVGTRLSATCCNCQTSHLSAKCSVKSWYRGILEDVCLDSRYATSKLGTLLCAISHNHNFVKSVAVVYQRNFYGLLEVIDIHFQRTIAYILHSQCKWNFFLCLELELTVHIRYGSLTFFIFHYYGCTNQRLTIACILYTSSYQPLCQSIERADCNDSCNYQSFYHILS